MSNNVYIVTPKMSFTNLPVNELRYCSMQPKPMQTFGPFTDSALRN